MTYDLKEKGFGILEVVIATGIIIVGLVAVISFIIQSYSVSQVNRNKFAATMLAQEGIELVRNMRDSNWVSGAVWNQNIAGDGTYRIEIDASGNVNIVNVSSIDDILSKLKINSGLYQHTLGVDTIFYRMITASNTASCLAANCLQITSTVKWSERGLARNYAITVELYNWK
ncbi:MAG: hypothetical protein M0Q92_00610 [Methanoregula sp.]|jgi:Tfp pilus assembly protein PilV|nr:hypothetical protein [Methanoregula sp.]